MGCNLVRTSGSALFHGPRQAGTMPLHRAVPMVNTQNRRVIRDLAGDIASPGFAQRGDDNGTLAGSQAHPRPRRARLFPGFARLLRLAIAGKEQGTKLEECNLRHGNLAIEADIHVGARLAPPLMVVAVVNQAVAVLAE